MILMINLLWASKIFPILSIQLNFTLNVFQLKILCLKIVDFNSNHSVCPKSSQYLDGSLFKSVSHSSIFERKIKLKSSCPRLETHFMVMKFLFNKCQYQTRGRYTSGTVIQNVELSSFFYFRQNNDKTS